MKIAILDCFSGISGDMTVAAFLDAGLVSLLFLKKELKKLGLGGYDIAARKVMRAGVAGTKFDVRLAGKSRAHTPYRRIKTIISKSCLAPDVKETALSIFERLAAAEAKIHKVKKEDVRFHEAGALDSIVDIVSTAAAVRQTGIERFYCLNLRLGSGIVSCGHGGLPLPAPAAIEILRGKPVSFSDAGHELVTPTGAAILTTLVEDFDERPAMKTASIGYGAGSFDSGSTPNLLRLMVGTAAAQGLARDSVDVIETNIDDMSPPHYEYLMERLFNAGALDVYLTPVYMKKTRPAVLLTALSRAESRDSIVRIILEETTTSGLRSYRAERQKLSRSVKTVRTKYGPIRVKINAGAGLKTVSPEYEDCKTAAKKAKAPLKEVMEAARNIIER